MLVSGMLVYHLPLQAAGQWRMGREASASSREKPSVAELSSSYGACGVGAGGQNGPWRRGCRGALVLLAVSPRPQAARGHLLASRWCLPLRHRRAWHVGLPASSDRKEAAR